MKTDRELVREMKSRNRARRAEMALRACFKGPHCTFDDDRNEDSDSSKQCRAYADRFDAMRAKGYGVLLYGAPGQGKTFLGECIADRLCKKGVRCLMTTSSAVVRGAQRFDGDPLRSYVDCDLLVLDDLGAERKTEFARDIIYELVNARYSMRAPMVVTTNLSPADMSDDASARTYDRILERCLPIEVETWRSRADAESYADMIRLLSRQDKL